MAFNQLGAADSTVGRLRKALKFLNAHINLSLCQIHSSESSFAKEACLAVRTGEHNKADFALEWGARWKAKPIVLRANDR